MPRGEDLFAAAKARVRELNAKIAALAAERDAILRGAAQLAGPLGRGARNGEARGGGGRRGRGSVIGRIVEAIEGSREGLTVGEILRSLPGGYDSKAVSSAIAQHLRGKSPRIKVIKRGGKGVPSRYAGA